MKTKKQILQQAYINQSELSTLLGIPYQPARKLFKTISKQEDEELGEYRIMSNKVSLKRVLKATHTDLSMLIKQAELEDKA